MITTEEKIEYLRDYDGRPLRLMEVCGTHTSGIFKCGIRSLLSPKIRLISGPGCPVCVTPTAYIDKCVEYALTPGFALVSFGDMLKVPGSRSFSSFSFLAGHTEKAGVRAANEDESAPVTPETIAQETAAPDASASGTITPDIAAKETAAPETIAQETVAQETVSLERAKGFGARVELVYSPFDVIAMAEREPDTVFVIAAVGFETTAPAYALLMDELISRQMTNVMFLTALKSALPAIEWVCESNYGIDGFLCPGHVSVITGSSVYGPLAEKYGKPFVVAGFEGAHLVDAIYELVKLADASAGDGLSQGDQETGADGAIPAEHAQPVAGLVVNRYREAVSEEGNIKAREITDRYFGRGAAVWRGLGAIADSGFYLRPLYVEFDAGSRSLTKDASLPEGCRCADVITGRIDPPDCPAFGQSCTPESAHGPCMVSAEGACGIWYANV